MAKSVPAVACLALLAFAALAPGQTSVTIESKTISAKMSAPAAKGRVAIAFHTEADLVFKGFQVPKGDYTMDIATGGAPWQLTVNKQNAKVGVVPMTMGKAPSPASACTVKVAKTAALAARLELACEDSVASTSFYLDRVAADREW